MTEKPVLSLSKEGVRASRARGGSQTRCAPDTPFGSPRWLSGSGFAGRAHGLDSTGFRGVRRDRDPDRRPAARPPSRHARPPYRHTRTCSGYLSQAAPPGGRMDTRNKSGHDGRACPEPVEGGVRASRARGGSQTPRAPETPGGLPFSLTQWLNRTAMEQVRVSIRPLGGRCPEQARPDPAARRGAQGPCGIGGSLAGRRGQRCRAAAHKRWRGDQGAMRFEVAGDVRIR